jgi:zinc transporter 2
LSFGKCTTCYAFSSGPGVKTQQVLLQASRLVRSRFNVFEMTLQIEEFEAGMSDCTQCQDPLD